MPQLLRKPRRHRRQARRRKSAASANSGWGTGATTVEIPQRLIFCTFSFTTKDSFQTFTPSRVKLIFQSHNRFFARGIPEPIGAERAAELSMNSQPTSSFLSPLWSDTQVRLRPTPTPQLANQLPRGQTKPELSGRDHQLSYNGNCSTDFHIQ